jgi:hypothetical protein
LSSSNRHESRPLPDLLTTVTAVVGPAAGGHTGPGGGAHLPCPHAPAQRRATTALVKHLYPWVAGTGVPMIVDPVEKTIRDHSSRDAVLLPDRLVRTGPT